MSHVLSSPLFAQLVDFALNAHDACALCSDSQKRFPRSLLLILNPQAQFRDLLTSSCDEQVQ